MQMKPLFQKVITLLLFIFVYFAITSNPIVKPKASAVSGLWTIEKAQEPLLFGFASHNYLILRDERNLVQKELHGTPTDKNGAFIKVSLVPGRILRVLELSEPLDGSRSYRPSAVTVYKGSEDEVLAKWQEGKDCARKINESKLPYPALGIRLGEETVNSNSVATEVLRQRSRYFAVFQ